MISSFDENLLPSSQVFMVEKKNNRMEPNLGNKVDDEVFHSVNQIIWPLQPCESQKIMAMILPADGTVFAFFGADSPGPSVHIFD